MLAQATHVTHVLLAIDGQPVAEPRVVLRDRFGGRLLVHEPPPGEPFERVPLSALPGPGRYAAFIRGRQNVEFLYAPSLRGRAPLALAELFLHGGPAAVPASARLLDGAAPAGRRFWADLPARLTRWRYVVAKTSGNADTELADYAVEPVPDGPPVARDGDGVFTTAAAVAWRRAPAQTRLVTVGPPGSSPVHSLPNPGPGTPLVEDGGATVAVHHVYV